VSLNFLEFLKGRRSIREYSSKDVSDEVLKRILEASRWAPSAHNAQPWRFIIIRDSALKLKLAEAMAIEWDRDLIRDGVPKEARESLIEDSIQRFTKPPVVIIACLAMDGMDRYPDKRRQEIERIMAVQSVAAAIENMLLAAHAEGLGSCWFCAPLFCENAVREVLEIPENVEVQALITLGYSAERPNPPPRKPLEEFTHVNGWKRKK
jgi:F420 biosynthesis protein FbiB-like protein